MARVQQDHESDVCGNGDKLHGNPRKGDHEHSHTHMGLRLLLYAGSTHVNLHLLPEQSSVLKLFHFATITVIHTIDIFNTHLSRTAQFGQTAFLSNT
mmetsp:Transcript_14664/g.40301  ORF Transcript_14664/g.40301 Transcript_14664/m.40301 type:complete len:97 (+) Transcript_14664:354-644(+)